MLMRTFSRLFASGLVFGFTICAACAAENPFLGEWALTIPGGGAGWLGVEDAGGRLQASLMWGAGSVVPLASAKVEDGKLVLTRKHQSERKDATGKTVKTEFIETLTASVEGNVIKIESVKPRQGRPGDDKVSLSGNRQPPVPPACDLASVKYGEPMPLFNGKDLTGWRLTDPHAISGWSIKDGLLTNDPAQEEGKPHKNYGNLRTDREFEDFNLKVEVRVSKGQNSGVYLRGIYECQVADTYGKPVDSHNMGAIYSRITPSEAAEKPPGEWQTLDITFVNRHATVILNGKRIIDNQPIKGCTGGALWSDVMRPGPIYLQGDHTGIEYRSLVLRPVIQSAR
jgi:hypothetical protein